MDDLDVIRSDVEVKENFGKAGEKCPKNAT